MTIEIASNVGPAHLEIAYERLGPPDAPPVLLVMGLGAQLIGWPDGLCDALVRHGLHVIRFDNRDAGQSTHLSGTPSFAAALAGDFSSAAYDLRDMASDTVGLLDALGLPGAHVVGASMGGFIAQMVAIEHPQRVRSLTSIMSTTGDPAVGQPHPEIAGLFAGGAPTTRAQAIDRAVQAARVIGSPAYPPDLELAAERAGLAFDRAFDPPAMVRQAVAVLASGDRTARLHEVRVPALVIHGAADPLVDVSGGHATAAAIHGAELVIVDGMGHDLPRALWPELATRIAGVIAAGEAARQDAARPA